MIGLGLWLGTMTGKLAVGAGVLALLVGIRAWDVSHQRRIGAEKERVRVERQGARIDAKAQNARRAAEQRPADSLRGYFRD